MDDNGIRSLEQCERHSLRMFSTSDSSTSSTTQHEVFQGVSHVHVTYDQPTYQVGGHADQWRIYPNTRKGYICKVWQSCTRK